MLKRVLYGFLIAMFSHSAGHAQQLPSVEKLIQDHDHNNDGKLEAGELRGSSFVRQLSGWDADRDGFASSSEIIVYRAKFGIAADGTQIPGRPARGAQSRMKSPLSQMLPVPAADDLTRADATTKLTAFERRNSAYVLRTQPHRADGTRYIILTDHHDIAFLDPLHRLAKHHDGILLEVNDLATLHLDQGNADALMTRLRSSNPKYVAIAPRVESMRENMLMHVWELLAQLDNDPQLDAYPGILVASNAHGLARLVDQSIRYQPQTNESLKPIAISQVPSRTELRSLQKSAILRRQLGVYGLKTPIVAVYTASAKGAPQLEGDSVWNLATTSNERLVRSLTGDASQAFQSANLVIMHGHGSPGMSCSLNISALPEDCSGKLLLTGSCFSAAPMRSDLPRMNEAPGGYSMTNEDAFALRAIDSGAVAAFGHMRLSQGFPHLYTVLESWMRGETIGESYQQLINGLIEKNQIDSRALVMDAELLKTKQPKQSVLMYVLIGDPALQPLVELMD